MTLVSHARQFVFLKTKKTGGSSLEMMLEPYCAPPGHPVVHETTGLVSEYGVVGVRVLPEVIQQLKDEGRMPHAVARRRDQSEYRINWFSHMPAAKVRRAIGPETFDRYLRLTAVRNPFTRAVSLFYYWMSIGKLEPNLGLTDTRAAFREFVLGDAFDNDLVVTHIQDKPVFHDAFRLERRDEDIPRIGERLGLPLDASQLPHVKRRDRSGEAGVPDIELFDQSVVDAIRRKSAWIFDNFDYTPDLEDAMF